LRKKYFLSNVWEERNEEVSKCREAEEEEVGNYWMT